MDALKSVELLYFEPKTGSLQTQIIGNVVKNNKRNSGVLGQYQRQMKRELVSCKKEVSEKKSVKRKRDNVPIWERSGLTLEEAASYSGVGRDKLRKLSDREDCPFVLWVGTKRLIRRKKLDEYLDKAYSI